ncbi:aspartyl protease family protein [Variovorax paradoxus]|uniref:aspartyl protease family protein n=1 Tax=Variovorax paradoxus TaxID=34073 RepID=UPI0030CC8CF1
MAALLRRQGKEVPERIELELLLDTGADTTTIKEMHMRSLGVPVRGATEVRGATTDAGATECNTYDLSLEFINSAGDRPLTLTSVEVIGRPFHNEMIDGVVGRDVMSNMVLTIEGHLRQFSVVY